MIPMEHPTFISQGERLAYARKQAGFKSISAAARALGTPEVTYRAHETGQRNLTENAARRYGQAFGINWTWILSGEGNIKASENDRLSLLPTPEPITPSRIVDPTKETDLPIYSTTGGGPTGMILRYEPVERIKRPEPLRNVDKGFGFYLIGESMSPRFEHGDILLVHPTRPAGRKDDVLVLQQGAESGEHFASVKRFVNWRGDQLLLEQLNPPEKLRPIARNHILGIHLIVGSYRGFR